LGVFYGGGFHFFGIQVLGVVAVIAWVAITMTIVFNVIKHTIGLRVSEAEEIMGLDKPEHGLSSAYADFMPVVPTVLGTKAGETAAKIKDTIPVAVEKAVPVTKVTTEGTAAAGGHKLSKIVIIAKQSKFEVLKEALASIGVSGMTVTNVVGCGVQKGAPEYYRGAEVDVTLLPKLKMEVVVSKVPVETVVETVKKVLYTGHIGDGKIFVYDVENVVKVRTGAEGFDALQDDN
ncbi:MAG: P-II family nitrogen regulator, partial [Agathobaculum butyriciproducens]